MNPSYLFFDTETTGMPTNWKAPISDTKNWPRIVQIAWILADQEGNELKNVDRLVRPDGFTIPPVSIKIHGITTEKALAEGLPLDQVLSEFQEDLAAVNTIVAHNIDFDTKVLACEFIRMTGKNALEKHKTICTMKRSSNFCQIPGKYGFKWPNLGELYTSVFDKSFPGAHNAKNDVRAMVDCFWVLRKEGVV